MTAHALLRVQSYFPVHTLALLHIAAGKWRKSWSRAHSGHLDHHVVQAAEEKNVGEICAHIIQAQQSIYWGEPTTPINWFDLDLINDLIIV